jgi:hypothetical protein
LSGSHRLVVSAAVADAVAAGTAAAVAFVTIAGFTDAVFIIVLRIPWLRSDKVPEIAVVEPVVL